VSIRVLEQVFDRSRSSGSARLVLAAIAEVAHHDGVTWCQQGPRENRRSLAHRANCGVRSVERAIEQLVELREVEVRRARRGRSWVNVYRVVVGRIGAVDVEYDRLPFELDEPFSTAAEIVSGGTRSTRQVGGLDGGAQTELEEAPGSESEAELQPANLAGSREGVNPSDLERSTRQPDELNPPNAPGTPSMDPSIDPSDDPSFAAAKSSSSTDDTELVRGLREARIAPDLRAAAIADPERAKAWLDVARKEATTNVAGFFASGFRSGEWPAERGAVVSAERRHQARLESLRNFVVGGLVAEAHDLVDDWSTLTQVERNEYHSLVDELVSEQLPEMAAAGVEPAREAAA
jgi:hypothetical protein